MTKAVLMAALLAGAAGSAQAAVIFSEDFSNPAFNGGVFYPSFSDRFGPTDYAYANNANGWTFVDRSNVFMAYARDGGNGALLLNENGNYASAYRTISGLTVGTSYTLSFLLSGDNIPGNPYRLTGGIAGLSFSINGVDGNSGTVPGITYSYNFTATSSSHVLQFGQVALSGASPMIDDILITGPGRGVPEPTSWVMLLAGFGMVGAAARRRRTSAAA